MLKKATTCLAKYRDKYGGRLFTDFLITLIGAGGCFLSSSALLKAGVPASVVSFPGFSPIVGILCGIFYDMHNTSLGRRLADLAVKEISPVLAASSKIPYLKDYAAALGKVSRFDEIVISRVLTNHCELLESQRYLMSFDGYLALLTELFRQIWWYSVCEPDSAD